MWRPPIAVAVVCRSVVVAAVGAIAIRAAVEEYPVLASHASAQASGGNGLFSVQAAGSGTGDVNPYGQGTPRVIRIPVVATLHGPRDFTAGLVLKDASGRAEYQGPSGLVEVAHDLSDGDILAWMQAAGIDRSRATAEREAAALRALLWHLLADGTDLRLTEPSGVFVGLDSVDVDAFKFIRPHGGAMACILIPLLGVWLALLNGLRGKRKQPTENHPESA